MTIEELCARSYKTAMDKGWHEEPRSMGEVTALFHSEVSEALECWRDPGRKLDETWKSKDGKPEGFVIELADLLIRIGDTCVDMGFPLAKVLNNIPISTLGSEVERDGKGMKWSIPEWLASLHVNLSQAYVVFIEQPGMIKPVVTEKVALSLSRVIVSVGIICHLNGLDLEGALVQKMAFNEGRPHRHGGKRG